MGHLTDAIFNSIDEMCDLGVIHYSQTTDVENSFYLLEQSSLQVLREFAIETPIPVIELFSQRHRVAQHIGRKKTTKTLKELFDFVLPLMENGNFPRKDLIIVINQTFKLQSHDDGEVHLTSKTQSLLEDAIRKILVRQHYTADLISNITQQPNLYHNLERPNLIVDSFQTFNEVMDSL